MNDGLNINSFDELKVALDNALRNGAASPEAADYLMERFEVLCMDIDNVFLAISANDIKEYYPNLSLDEAREVRDNANENLWNSGGYCDIRALVAKSQVLTTLPKRMASRALAKEAATCAIRRASQGRRYFCPLACSCSPVLHASR